LFEKLGENESHSIGRYIPAKVTFGLSGAYCVFSEKVCTFEKSFVQIKAEKTLVYNTLN